MVKEIDQVIDAHGGWPAAFQGEPPLELGGEPKEKSQNVVRLPSATAHKDKKPAGLLEAAEPPSTAVRGQSHKAREDEEVF